jgi:hypothetical protein
LSQTHKKGKKAEIEKLKMLVGETTCGGFETLGGDKTHCFITRTQAYN